MAPNHKKSVYDGVDLVTSLRQLRDCSFYWGPLDKEEAEMKLCYQPEGSFLLRDSSDEKHFFALSLRMAGRTHHIRISYAAGSFSFDYIQVDRKFASILDLIYDVMDKSKKKEMQYFVKARGAYDAPLPVSILYPISRDNVVHSLTHLTRAKIRKYVRLDHIDGLAIPSHLKSYLRDSRYLFEESDSDLAEPPLTLQPASPAVTSGNGG